MRNSEGGLGKVQKTFTEHRTSKRTDDWFEHRKRKAESVRHRAIIEAGTMILSGLQDD